MSEWLNSSCFCIDHCLRESHSRGPERSSIWTSQLLYVRAAIARYLRLGGHRWPWVVPFLACNSLAMILLSGSKQFLMDPTALILLVTSLLLWPLKRPCLPKLLLWLSGFGNMKVWGIGILRTTQDQFTKKIAYDFFSWTLTFFFLFFFFSPLLTAFTKRRLYTFMVLTSVWKISFFAFLFLGCHLAKFSYQI